MDEDQDSGESPGDDIPRYRGKTYKEWVFEALELANYDPLEFVNKDEEEIRKLIDKNRGLQIALMEIGSIFGDKQSMKAVQALYSKKLTDKAQLTLRVPAPGGGHGQMKVTDGQNGEVDTMLRNLLRGDVRIPQTAFVPTADQREVQATYERTPENFRAKS